MTLGPFTENHFFLPYDTAPANQLGRNILSKLKGLICFPSNEEFTLEFIDQPEPDLSNLFLT